MTPVDLPYVPILLNENIHYSPVGHGSGEIFYIRGGLSQIFFYRPHQKTKDRVVTAQGAPSGHFGIDFMKKSKLTLDFDKKSLIIPDDQIKQLPKKEKPVEIDLSDAKLGAAPNFQKAIDMILKSVLGRFVMVYMDDVIITSQSFNEHTDHLNQVFTLLRDAGLTLHKDKCHFARDKLRYLGLIISNEGIETDDNKVKAITEMKPPKNNKEMSKILGMAGWYQKFIPHYADICEPSCRLKKKGLNLISRRKHRMLLINDNGPQFISDVFEHLSHRLDIKHTKTVTYRPQANLTERVNRNLVQMIACFVEENHDNWGRFLHEFFFTLRTTVNESTGKIPAELCLGKMIITPFRKLVRVTEGAEYVGGNIVKLFDEARQNMRKQHKTWEKYYNRKRRGVNIKVNDLVLVQTHFISAEGVYHPRQSDTISFDSNDETLYEGKRSSNGSSRSHPGKSKSSRKTLSDDSKGRKSNKGTAGLEDLGLKRKVRSNGPVEKNDKKRSKICRKTSLQGSKHGDQKRPTPVSPHGIKRTVPSSITSRNHKYRRPNNPSQGPESSPSHQLDIRQSNPPTEESRQGARVLYDRAWATRTTPRKGHSAAEGRPVRSRQTTAVRSCPYYLRSRLKEPEGIQEEQRALGSTVYRRTASGEGASAWKP
ncbi:retrovirus-related Pol polyprotein from transposon 297 [Trichonephila clavipes]|uniref:Retrovirus-related Pol polyprotein from transposon 297 n=1 Tax=Trichonephila clavipes TaxID=2585209 RepID=A0A8X7BDM9_TRICX|nr:retrovirus-related Pol polyprotein from transposon 297 [Trichonephila clavipes]